MPPPAATHASISSDHAALARTPSRPSGCAGHGGALGPWLSQATVARLRQLVCPTNAAAVILTSATDADVANLNACTPHLTRSGGSGVEMLGGTYRVPPHARL